MNIVAQLVEIYYRDEWWHKSIMTPEEAYNYHKKRIFNGNIYVYEEEGKLLGYYERYINGDTCELANVWVREGHRRGKVFKRLYREFFRTLPREVDKIKGERQSLGGKFQEVLLSKHRRSYGVNKDRVSNPDSSRTYGR